MPEKKYRGPDIQIHKKQVAFSMASLDKVQGIYATTWADVYNDVGSQYQLSKQELRQRAKDNLEFLRANDGKVQVAKIDSEQIGCIGYYFQTYVGRIICHVDFVYVKPEFRHKGFAKALLDVAIQAAKAKKACLLEAYVGPNNHSSKALFKAVGCFPTGTMFSKRLTRRIKEQNPNRKGGDKHD